MSSVLCGGQGAHRPRDICELCLGEQVDYFNLLMDSFHAQLGFLKGL
jgi:hypothetical protein